MKRAAILVVTILIGAAAPVRAWCEATCLAPAAGDSQAHCATHEPASDAATISATDIDDCPVVESARPATAKIELLPLSSSIPWQPILSRTRIKVPAHSGTQRPTHLIATPLRI